MADREHGENERKCAEDEGLNGADEQFKAVEDDEYRRRHRKQESHHEQQDLAGHHVSEQTEGETDQPGKLGDELQNAHKSVDPVNVEELPQVTEEPHGADAPVLDKESRDEREREGRHQVRVDSTEEGCQHAYLLTVLDFVVRSLLDG